MAGRIPRESPGKPLGLLFSFSRRQEKTTRKKELEQERCLEER
jgi:hypothetical protein